jgi:hypothetical protein
MPLSAPAADVAVGGGGRYLVLKLAGKKKLAVFDVQQGKVARELPLLEEEAHIAAGATRLVVIYPGAKLLQLWDLGTLERERSAALPGNLTQDTIHQICLGSASPGPLFVYLPREKRTLALDLKSLETTEVHWAHWAPNNAYGPLNMRASADGSLLLGWGGGWAGLDIASFSGGSQVGNFDRAEFSGGAFALATADGSLVFTPWGVLNRAFAPVTTPELRNVYLVPAAEPGFFLALRGGGVPVSYVAGPVSLPAVGEVGVYGQDRTLLFRMTDCDELKAGSDLPWEKRVHYYPRAGLLVTLGRAKDRLILHKVDLADRLEKSGADYLVVVSRPPPAKAGSPFTYRLDVRSRKGGVKVKLESGPPGLKVTPAGEVTWAVPGKFDEPEADVLVTVGDTSGQETVHRFTVEVAGR